MHLSGIQSGVTLGWSFSVARCRAVLNVFVILWTIESWFAITGHRCSVLSASYLFSLMCFELSDLFQPNLTTEARRPRWQVSWSLRTCCGCPLEAKAEAELGEWHWRIDTRGSHSVWKYLEISSVSPSARGTTSHLCNCTGGATTLLCQGLEGEGQRGSAPLESPQGRTAFGVCCPQIQFLLCSCLDGLGLVFQPCGQQGVMDVGAEVWRMDGRQAQALLLLTYGCVLLLIPSQLHKILIWIWWAYLVEDIWHISSNSWGNMDVFFSFF